MVTNQMRDIAFAISGCKLIHPIILSRLGICLIMSIVQESRVSLFVN
jgi:hypothetical protein